MASDQIAEVFEEFVRHFADSEPGRAHLRTYERHRRTGRENLRRVVAMDRRGEEFALAVLKTLLPHANTPHNRSNGSWIHIAPAITKDVVSWFENAGWTQRSDWPAAAAAIVDFYDRVQKDPDDLAAACEHFAAKPVSKGFQSAFLSPMLNALYPDRFCIVNSKSRKTAKAFSRTRYPLKLVKYPVTNRRLHELIAAVSGQIQPLLEDGVRETDVFDAFCHWYIALRPRKEGEKPRRVAIPDRSDPEVAAAWFRRTLPQDRAAAIERLLAVAIEAAHQRAGEASWSITLKARMLRLNVGRLAAMSIWGDQVHIGAPRQLAESILEQLSPENVRVSHPFTSEPSAAICEVDPALVGAHEPLFASAVQAFMDLAAGFRSPYARSHSQGVVEYLASAVGRTLPEPRHGGETEAPKTAAEPPPDAVRFSGPRTLFNKVEYELSTLLEYIRIGDIALPELQRPFVWKATKVRDLFDSMYRGYPVGYLLFWSNKDMKGRTIGSDPKQHVPNLLIVDGQQRLTSLYAVFRGIRVLDDNFQEKTIEIAFRPRDGRFEVADAAIRRDPEFVANISDLWCSGKSSYSLTHGFIEQIEATRPLSDEDREAMSHNLDRLYDLQKYPFTALEIVAGVEEENVADIFVRINSEGVQLNQSDFLLTLLSVFWADGRKDLESFARRSAHAESATAGPTPFNHLIQSAPDQLLRAAIAVGFYRARLKSVYQVLRAKELDGSGMAAERREAQFAKLRQAQAAVLNLDNWHGFLHAIRSAGYRSAEMISSGTALMYSYSLYLIGKGVYKVPAHRLDRLIGRWFFANTLTGRYSGSFETTMEEDLAGVRDLPSADAFVSYLESRLAAVLTHDYWETTHPLELETSSRRSPAAIAYTAAQVRLNAPVLFSDKPLIQVLDPTIKPPKSPIDRHHLFPKRYLQRTGIKSPRETNQVANFAHVEWPDNLAISAKAPNVYVPDVRERFSAPTWDAMCRAHALPPNWYELSYEEFLRQRRQLMAALIRRGYENLSGEPTIDVERDASKDELRVWELIRDAERQLRSSIRRTYDHAFGAAADSRIRTVLGPQGVEAVERARTKRQSQFSGATEENDDLLDYTYLGQLVALMLSNDAWVTFRGAFRDKRELEDLAAPITKVRNEAAHFRHVPENDLDRCRVAAADLLERLGRLESPRLPA